VTPAVLQEGPYRFFLYSSDRAEPPHVHVERDERRAKFWLSPVRLQKNSGFPSAELRRIEGLVNENESRILKAWHDFFEA
jgi:hypothetical protein